MTITGVFIRFLWRNEKTGESRFTIKADKETVYTCDGIIQGYPKGIPLKIVGTIKKEKEWDILACESIAPCGYDFDSIFWFLVSKEFPEVGQLTAKSIIDTYGVDLFSYCGENYDMKQILSKDPHQSETTERVFRKLHYINHFEMLYHYIKEHGGDYFNAMKVFEKFGSDSISALKHNPYILIYADAPFSVCESIANENNIEACDKRRIKALVELVIENNRKRGDTRIAFHDLCMEVRKEEERNNNKLKTSFIFIAEEVMNERYFLDDSNDGIDVYLYEDYEAERQIVDNINRINTSAVPLNHSTSGIEQIEEICGVKYATEQKQTFNMLRASGIKIVTGGPGTGKTTVLNGILRQYEKENPGKIVQLCAPTGCAARHMQESTGRASCTIHKLLDIRPFENITKNTVKKLPADCIVVDECSMIDTYIMARLLASVKNGALLILLGDKDQLPSVGAGNVFADILESKTIEAYYLKTIFRQGNRSIIIDNSKKIINGQKNLLTDGSFKIRRFANEDQMIEDASTIAGLYFKKSNTDFKLYTPSRRYKFKSGSINMNRVIKKMKDMGKVDSIFFGSYTFSVGDKIIFNKNNYGKGYYNGQEGHISCIQKHNGTTFLTIATDDDSDSITLSGAEIDDIELGYAITAHKSQGGECEDAIILIPQKPASLLKRQLLYVEVTRARKHVLILSEGDALEKAISGYMEHKRNTGLLKILSLSNTYNK